MGLPKAHRLRNRQDFNQVYSNGVRRSTEHMTLRALQVSGMQAAVGDHQSSNLHQGVADRRPDIGADITGADITTQPTQIGIVVSLKVSKRAVVRNRIRRRIQAAIRELLPQLAPCWKLVIIARPGLIQCNYQEILQQLKQLLTDSQVLYGHS